MTAPNSASVRAPDCPVGRTMYGEPCEGPGSYYCDMGLCQRLLEDRARGVESPAESLARRFHEAYEQLAPAYSYATRRDSAVPWAMVPERNRRLMVATAQAVLDGEPQEHPDLAYIAERLRETYEQEGVDIVLAHVRKVQMESADLRRRVDAVLALPDRAWDEDDADSAEARSARAYNHALAIASRALSSSAPGAAT